ncbi:hypothetical protein BHOIPH791_10020 [Bartonella henselae]|nr:hypothetical protein BH623125_13040 [Bartonella henselae]GFF03653.1 hypothetical protein BH80429_04740 [Bartonella henselae]
MDGAKSEYIFDLAFGVELLADPCFIGFHIHRKAKTTQKSQEGSFYNWALSRILGAHDLFC